MSHISGHALSLSLSLPSLSPLSLSFSPSLLRTPTSGQTWTVLRQWWGGMRWSMLNQLPCRSTSMQHLCSNLVTTPSIPQIWLFGYELTDTLCLLCSTSSISLPARRKQTSSSHWRRQRLKTHPSQPLSCTFVTRYSCKCHLTSHDMSPDVT